MAALPQFVDLSLNVGSPLNTTPSLQSHNYPHLLLVFSPEGRVSQPQAQGVDVVLQLGALDLVVGLRGEEKCVHIKIDYSPFWRAPRLPRLVSF